MIGTAEKGPIALTPNVQRDYALSLVKVLSTMDMESVSNGTQMSDNIRGGAFKIISLTEVEPPRLQPSRMLASTSLFVYGDFLFLASWDAITVRGYSSTGILDDKVIETLHEEQDVEWHIP